MAAHLHVSRFFLLLLHVVTVLAFYNVSVTELRVVETSLPRLGRRNGGIALEQRAVTTELSTCGYVDGDPSKIRTAEPGYDCRIDITKGLWGFCPTTVISASDCGLAGVCVDQSDCSEGCGLTGTEGITTFTCTKSGENFCSTALNVRGVDQTFSYIACGASAEIITLLAEPSDETTSSTSATATSKENVVGSSSTSQPVPASTTPQSGSLLTNPSEPTTQAQQQQSGGSSTNTGGIIGGVLGGLALVCGTVLAALYLLRRGRQRQRESQEAANAINGMAQSGPNKDYSAYSMVPSPSEADSVPVARPQTHPAEVYGSPAWRQHSSDAQELP
ncbi:uncharacterized protein F4822DRAFT_444509 [Hypoxylon trugodes]|uniref:uncharacterized protein n=1 Tax=Hypoxylon trugodes TaxID=326681 RepID=UPI0021914F0C|nr:uncharacterized protein F4822DRAFT_444509 [Hypoxylon trugodes]KAI1388053.1 hypothetical protein F4822DRAFT_444509 [Hypoxylon trugodes]